VSDADRDLSVSQSVERGITVVALHGLIDINSVDQLAAALRVAVEEDRPVVIDLARIESLDSTGLRVLLDARAAMVQRNEPLAVVCDAHGSIAKMLDVAGAGRFLHIYATREQALDGIGAQGSS
jgi:anti-sigma B factor antagonist